MKKKKLKKKIKNLELRLTRLAVRLDELNKKFKEKDEHLGEDWQAAVRVSNDGYLELKKAKETYEKLERSIKNTLNEFENRLAVIDARTKVDYTQFSSKTCDTCKWKPLMEQGGQDIPCMGCTADDKKMWKSKED